MLPVRRRSGSGSAFRHQGNEYSGIGTQVTVIQTEVVVISSDKP